MRIFYILKKMLKETLRDWKILLLCLIFGPAFVLLFHVFYSSSAANYKVVIGNYDKPVISEDGNLIDAGNFLIDQLKTKRSSDGSKFYTVRLESNMDKALKDVKDQKYDIYVGIPEDFSKSIESQKHMYKGFNTKLILRGDMTSFKYLVAAITIGDASENLVNRITGRPKTVDFDEKSTSVYKERTDFESAIPSCIFIGIIMLVFTSSIALIKEVESGTIRRLQISRTSSAEMIAAVTISQLFIGTAAVFITIIIAFNIFGGKSEGPMLLVYLISILCCFAVISVGFILAGFSRNISDIMIIGNLPYFLLLLLSGALPLPRLSLFTLGGHTVAVNDIFPTTPAMTALKMVMDQGKGLAEVSFELTLMIVLTVIYFMLGIYLFNKKHMKLS